MLKKLTGVLLAIVGAFAIGGIALHRHEPINALWIVTAASASTCSAIASTPPGSRPGCCCWMRPGRRRRND